MNDNLENKANLKDKIGSFLKKNKLKLIFFIIIILISFTAILIVNILEKKKNLIISEKYIKAGFLLSNDQKYEALVFYEDIIFSKNKFYSPLALNTILEKDLVNDKIKILEYFSKLEELNLTEDYEDIILFKKALFFQKIKDPDAASKIIEKLINKNSKFKSLAQEIID